MAVAPIVRLVPLDAEPDYDQFASAADLQLEKEERLALEALAALDRGDTRPAREVLMLLTGGKQKP